jgi:chromosome segregation ATPase
MSEDVQTDDAKPASKPDEPAKTEEAKGNSATAVSTSKIDSLSREDLVRLIRKQMVHLKDARKQLEELKKEKATDTKQEEPPKEPLSTTEMITMELKDYKTSLEDVKKKLAATEVTINEKDTLLNEISTKLQTLNEEKAQLSEFLKQAEATRIKLDKELQEKNMMIAESQKEHQALSLGSEQIRSNLEDEIVTLQSSLRQAKDELANERKENLQKTTDLRSTREKCVSLKCQLNDLRHEFNGFKEKAQYVLKQKGEEQKPTAKNEEVEELIRTVSARNEKIATLTEKCSFLEEDRHAAKEYAKTLRAEIDEVNGELTKNRRSTEEAQRRLIRYEQTFKQNASTIEQLNQELLRLRKQFNDEKALNRKLSTASGGT